MHIQTDAIRSMIPAPAYTWAEARFVYESAFLVARQALISGYDAILDGTFLREDYRAEARAKLGRYSSAIAVVCILCDLEVARARNSARDANIPDESFDRLSASFEEPEKAIFVRSDRRTPDSAAGHILRALRANRQDATS